jgi:hypothetical protein
MWFWKPREKQFHNKLPRAQRLICARAAHAGQRLGLMKSE